MDTAHSGRCEHCNSMAAFRDFVLYVKGRKPIDVSLKMFRIVNKKGETLAQISTINHEFLSL